MVLFCKCCGEENNFECRWTDTEDYEAPCNNDMDIEYSQKESVNEGDSSGHEYFCISCGEEALDFDEDQIAELKIKHTESDGRWSEKELPEDEWNEKLKLEYAANKL